MPQFSTDWFNHHEPQWRALMAHMRWSADQPLTALEIGSFEGRSACWLLQNALVHPQSRLVCVDSFEGGVEHSADQTSGLFDRFQTNIAETGAAHKVSIRRGFSGPELVRLLGEGARFDFAYIDGSHQAPDVLEDLVLTFRMVKVGGLIICDDYLWSLEPAGREDLLNSPKLAIDAFVNVYRRKLRVPLMQRLCQLAFVKTHD